MRRNCFFLERNLSNICIFWIFAKFVFEFIAPNFSIIYFCRILCILSTIDIFIYFRFDLSPYPYRFAWFVSIIPGTRFVWPFHPIACNVYRNTHHFNICTISQTPETTCAHTYCNHPIQTSVPNVALTRPRKANWSRPENIFQLFPSYDILRKFKINLLLFHTFRVGKKRTIGAINPVRIEEQKEE